MSKREKGFFILLVGACAWVILMSVLSLFGNGLFYSIEQPVRVVEVSGRDVTLEFSRRSWGTYEGKCLSEIRCGGLSILVVDEACLLEKGSETITGNVQIPDECGQSGEGCYVYGSMSYEPFGLFGPSFIYPWESEKFDFRVWDNGG